MKRWILIWSYSSTNSFQTLPDRTVACATTFGFPELSLYRRASMPTGMGYRCPSMAGAQEIQYD